MRRDLRTDVKLRFILLLALLLYGGWFWWRAPNFATPDEYGRLLRPMKAIGGLLAEGTYSSFVSGATDGVPQGATFYLYGLTLIPVGAYVVVTGRVEEFASFASVTSRWDLWHAVPRWYWEASILSARAVNVAMAVATVYVVYRIGTQAWDRRAGRYSAISLVLMLAFIGSAHEIDEDTAMLLSLMVATYLALRYVQDGAPHYALLGAFTGGVSIALKLTAGAIVVILGMAVVARKEGGDVDALIGQIRSLGQDWRLISSMAGTGMVTIYLGRPHVLFLGPSELLYRLTWATSYSSTSKFIAPPPGYLQAHSFLSALGLPLATAFVVGVGWLTYRTVRRRNESRLPIVLLPAMALYILVFGQWGVVKPHHLLPMLVVGAVLIGRPLAQLSSEGSNRVARVAIALLVATSALYAGVGAMSFANDPRDQAADWVSANVDSNETHLVYENSVADIGITHGQPVTHYDYYEAEVVPDSTLNASAYTEWTVESPDREPDYIQVTAQSALYTDPLRNDRNQYPARAAFFDQLIYGDHFGYEVAAEFGQRPPREGYAERLIAAGITPQVEKREQYVLILRRPDDR